jgi:NlpC/P60 family putative phage cell wall peptidase
MTSYQTNERVLAECRKWLGTPYLHQASRIGVGCDCIGLIRGIWRTLYGSEPQALPGYTPDWNEVSGREEMLAAAGKHFGPASELQPGNLIIFRWKEHLPAKHAGICFTQESFVHSHESGGVIRSSLGSQWRKRVAGIFTFPAIGEGSQ